MQKLKQNRVKLTQGSSDSEEFEKPQLMNKSNFFILRKFNKYSTISSLKKLENNQSSKTTVLNFQLSGCH
jgi:hypothetical protein